VLKDGALQQVGTPEELYHEPASAFVFDLLGDTIQFACTIDGGIAVIDGFGAPIRGVHPNNGAAIAYARPDEFSIESGEARASTRACAISSLPARTRASIARLNAAVRWKCASVSRRDMCAFGSATRPV